MSETPKPALCGVKCPNGSKKTCERLHGHEGWHSTGTGDQLVEWIEPGPRLEPTR